MGGRKKERERERERAKENATRLPRRAASAFARQLLWNRCLDDTHSRMRVRDIDGPRRRRQSESCARQFRPSPSVSPCSFHHHLHRRHHHRHRPPPSVPPPPSPRESSALFLSVSLPPFLSPPSPRDRTDARARARQRVNGSARCHRRETSFRGSRGGRPAISGTRSLACARARFLTSPRERLLFASCARHVNAENDPYAGSVASVI